MDRRETLVDELLFGPLDLLDSPFGDPLPTTIHTVSVLDRTTQILDEIEQIAKQRTAGWTPRLIWEPYYVNHTPFPSLQAGVGAELMIG